MTLFERTKETAKQRGMSLKSLNDQANLGKNAIYSWKTSKPGMSALQAVADVLGVSVDYLLGNTDEMHPAKSSAKEPVDLDEILNEEGMAMFEGQPLSEEYKKALLAMLKANKNSGN